MLKSFLLLSAASLFVLSPALMQASQDATPAPAAASHAGAPNPVKATPDGLAKAKGLYQIDCAMCHGDNGNGQTDLAKSMSLSIPDFTNGKECLPRQMAICSILFATAKTKCLLKLRAAPTTLRVWNLIHYIRKMASTQ